MYYIMSKFPFLYVGLKKTIKDIFELGGEKKFGLEKPKISNCWTNRYPVNAF